MHGIYETYPFEPDRLIAIFTDADRAAGYLTERNNNAERHTSYFAQPLDVPIDPMF